MLGSIFDAAFFISHPLNILQPELAHLGVALLDQVDAEPFDVVDADLVNVKFVLKPAGFEINFRYRIDLQHVWVVGFPFYPCTFSLHGYFCRPLRAINILHYGKE